MDYELKAALDAFGAEHKTGITGLKTQLDEMKTAQGQMQIQLDAVDKKTLDRSFIADGGGTKSLGAALIETAEAQHITRVKSGRVVISVDRPFFEAKTTITSDALGRSTPGILNAERIPGIVDAPRRRLTIRDLIPSRPTTAGTVDWVRKVSFTSAASPQTEGSAKGESAATFEVASARVATLAHWIPATRQCLDDAEDLRAFLDSEMLFQLKLYEEFELLSGDGTGLHIDGLIHQATSFDVSLLGSDGWNKADVIRRAIQQARSSEYPVDFVVLNPVDLADMELLKTTGTASSGEYVIRRPTGSELATIWGRPIVETNAMNQGYFLVGASMAAEIRDRQQAVVEISTEHADFWSRNMVAIRAEERLALCVRNSGALVYGQFSSSPA